MKWLVDDVPVFIAVVEQKGVTAAADLLSIPKSTVSRTISRLEEGLGVRLLERNSRNIRLTSDGEAFYHHALLIMEQVEEANDRMSGLTAEPKGQLTVALPMAFAREVVAPHLNEFRLRYPEIELEIVVSSHHTDLIQERIDIAVQVGPLEDSDLVAKPLVDSGLAWICSPEYIEQHTLGTSADDLLKHVFIGEKRYCHSELKVKDHGKHRVLNLSGAACINDTISVRKAVEGGAGVSMVPLLYCRDQLENGSLIRVFEDVVFESGSALISAVYPGRRLLSNKSRAFLDFLGEVTQL